MSKAFKRGDHVEIPNSKQNKSSRLNLKACGNPRVHVEDVVDVLCGSIRIASGRNESNLPPARKVRMLSGIGRASRVTQPFPELLISGDASDQR